MRRKDLNRLLYNIKTLKEKYKMYKDYIISLNYALEYENTVKHFDDLVIKLNSELSKLPIGFRYNGRFFIKNSHPISIEFKEYCGSAYMREDLISWQIENSFDPRNFSYHRNIYKEARENSEIKKEDAEPVYAPNS